MQDALITLTGNVGTDVEFTQGEGWQLARFRLACTPRRLREGAWVDTETTWIGITAWGRTAENMKTSLSKGDPVLVTGKLRTNAWIDKEGIRHERLVVEATALGHDLTRGRSEFTRNQKRIIVDEQGNRIDTFTGMVLPPEQAVATQEPPVEEGDCPPDDATPEDLPPEPSREEHLTHA
ncbi:MULTISPECIES: single-stranded DNA-binding protein [unclassified Luteococcus]|uniref:single-stranded DNA-binding protein n=1 Tax=unclassified Luteococcus TaxID=2639923 RepID=UPI00313F0D40